MTTGFSQQFETYIGSGFPLILVDTIEIERSIDAIADLVTEFNANLVHTNADEWLKTSGLKVYVWDCISGWHEYGRKHEKGGIIPNTITPADALRWLSTVEPDDGRGGNRNKPQSGVYIMQNFQFFWQDTLGLPEYIQLMKNFADVGKSNYQYLMLVGSGPLPKEIANYFVTMEFPLPDKKTIESIIGTHAERLGVKLKAKDIDIATSAVAGMTEQEIIGAVCVSVVKNQGKKIDKETLFDEKAKAVRKSQLLEYVHSVESIDTIGGLSALKDWIRQIAKAFANPKEAEKYGLPPAKGAMFVGVSGTGKSLTAKALANIFGVPLYRLDVGKVFSSLVGSTEANTRELLRLIDAVSPAVILID